MTARAPSGGGSRFDDPERLRRTLLRLHAKGKDAWRDDPDADELARYAMDRFAALATKHGLDPADGGSAAFEAMRNPSVVLGENPWAVIVHAVKTTMAARQFADEALCSVETARRGGLSGRRAERFSDRETPVWERHPAFARLDEHPGLDEHVDGGAASPSVGDQAASVAGLLAGRGWPVPQAAVAAEVVLRRLADCGSRPAAYERLRREKRWRVVAGLPQRSWTGLLRLLLGDTGDRAGVTEEGRGVMLRLALGETVEDLREDDLLGRRIEAAAPRDGGGRPR